MQYTCQAKYYHALAVNKIAFAPFNDIIEKYAERMYHLHLKC